MPGFRLTVLIMGDKPERLGAVVAAAGPWKAPNTLSAIIIYERKLEKRDVDATSVSGTVADSTPTRAAARDLSQEVVPSMRPTAKGEAA